MVLVLTFGLALFGLAQVVGTSGFLAIYIAGVVVGASDTRTAGGRELLRGIAWLAHIVLFLMLGLLVTPHDLVPFIPISILVAMVLIVVARPAATFACLLPFRYPWRGRLRVVGRFARRGADLSQLPARPGRSGPRRKLFCGVFVVVVVSLVIQADHRAGRASAGLRPHRIVEVPRVVSPIVIAGDPHGNFPPILRACAAEEPGTLILLGDCELRVPLHHMLGSLFAAGWSIHWIIGNKDAETATVFDHLATDFPEGDIGGKVIEVGGLRIAGLGGVFKPRIWYPRVDEQAGRCRAARLQHPARVSRQPQAERALARRAAAVASRFDLPEDFAHPRSIASTCW
jgi:hypothetical protein